jgi:hypothetical protein
MDFNRRLPQGSAERENCARFETLASPDEVSIGGGSKAPTKATRSDRRSPPALLELAPLGPHNTTKGRVRCKKIQIKPRKLACIPWIFLAELGLFNGLRRKKIKKLPPAKLASKVVRDTVSEDKPILNPLRPWIFFYRNICPTILDLSTYWAIDRDGRQLLRHTVYPSWEKQPGDQEQPLQPRQTPSASFGGSPQASPDSPSIGADS